MYMHKKVDLEATGSDMMQIVTPVGRRLLALQPLYRFPFKEISLTASVKLHSSQSPRKPFLVDYGPQIFVT